MELSKDVAAALSAYLKPKKAIVCDPTMSSRSTIKKMLCGLGCQTANVLSVERYAEAESLLKQHKAPLLFQELTLDGKSCFDIFKIFQDVHPDRLNAAFFVLSSVNSPAIAAQAAEEDADGILFRPFTMASIQDAFLNLIMPKLKPSAYLLALEKSRPLILNAQFDEAIQVLNQAKTLDPKPTQALVRMGGVSRSMNKVDEAIQLYEDVLKIEPDNYKALVSLVDIYVEQKNYAKAYDTAGVLRTKYPGNPQRMPMLISLSIRNQKYDDLVEYQRIFATIEQPPEPLATYIAAGLVVCAKYQLRNGRPTQASELLKHAGRASLTKPKILIEVITTLFQAGMDQEAEDFLSKAPEEVRKSPTIGLCRLEAMHGQEGASPAKVAELALTLKKNGIREQRLFEILIQRSIEIKRPASAINDLIGEAKSLFPELKEHFEKLNQAAS